jgi:hypothetical protein
MHASTYAGTGERRIESKEHYERAGSGGGQRTFAIHVIRAGKRVRPICYAHNRLDSEGELLVRVVERRGRCPPAATRFSSCVEAALCGDRWWL